METNEITLKIEIAETSEKDYSKRRNFELQVLVAPEKFDELCASIVQITTNKTNPNVPKQSHALREPHQGP